MLTIQMHSVASGVGARISTRAQTGRPDADPLTIEMHSVASGVGARISTRAQTGQPDADPLTIEMHSVASGVAARISTRAQMGQPNADPLTVEMHSVSSCVVLEMSTSARGPAPTEKSAARLRLHALRVEPVARAWYWRGSCVPLHPRRAHLRNAQHIESICARDIHIATRASVRSCIHVAIGMPSTSTPVDDWRSAPARAPRPIAHRRSPFKSTVLRVVSGGRCPHPRRVQSRRALERRQAGSQMRSNRLATLCR